MPARSAVTGLGAGCSPLTMRGRGWQVTVFRGGLGRSYRDLRFDLLARCPQCRGAGTGADDLPCSRCPDTGRLTLDRPASSAGR